MMTQDYDPSGAREGRESWSSSGSSGATTREGGITEQAGDVAAKAQEKAGEVGGKVQDRADAGIDRAAEGIQQAAAGMRERFEDQGGMPGQVGTRVADGLERTAGYLREHDSAEMWSDAESFIKEHPLQACAGALVAGFFVGRVLR
jgi:ElaB/YqjD/DUF883 family membrane-anchored ribosome-binding protein